MDLSIPACSVAVEGCSHHSRKPSSRTPLLFSAGKPKFVLRPGHFIPPAQPTERTRPPKGEGWLHWVKWDGNRCQLSKLADRVVVYSRNGKDFSSRFPLIRQALLKLSAKSALIDAEIVACRADGTPDLRALHSGNYNQDVLCAWCFDLMELDGAGLTRMPLVERRTRLEAVLRRSLGSALRYSEDFEHPQRLRAECTSHGLEGIVSKRKDAPYSSGSKSDWIKVKCAQWKKANKDRGDLFGPGRRP